ncbi:hypothetical protein PPUJ20005_38220 [Pseudomonas putida]|uniref:DUF4760 domain-containing protein n=1 Tax=Pseudomonas putida TaxID=303 RepID=UPI00235D8DC1|nr:DUF4760 domain-containing protein [Pseudomonas putida]GLO09853.1 hypothetical protein PPUJ20005_38220 [Pseudomonas putida]HDS0987059.1 DUF4760 domain-containing protein [Pseudomonas putida]
MIFNLVNKYKYLLPIIYGVIGVLLCAVLIAFFCAQIKCTDCSLATINPLYFIMPLLTYGSIGLVGLTIGFSRKTASEKNALDFDKIRSDLNDAFAVIAIVRKKLAAHDSTIDRRKAYGYMQGLESAVKKEKDEALAAEQSGKTVATASATSANFAFMMCSSSGNDQGSHSFVFCAATPEPQVETPASAPPPASAGTKETQKPSAAKSEKSTEKAGGAEPTYTDVSKAAFRILNAFEGCANAIRYGIYDEDFIYNVYGSQFIDFYELTYGLMKSRQRELPRAWVNFEWLAVKWTLRRKITGVTSKEWEETSYIIQESLAAIKEHTKVRPNPEKLQKFMDKLERRKFPA